MRPLPVAILMVTYNSAGDLPGGLAAVGALAPSPSELVIVDCASTDASVAEARRSAPASIPTTLEPLADNRGFAGGMNRAVALSTAPYLLTLNADARPAPGFLAPLVARLEEPRFARVAAVTGRLVREQPPASAGTPARRKRRRWPAWPGVRLHEPRRRAWRGGAPPATRHEA